MKLKNNFTIFMTQPLIDGVINKLKENHIDTSNLGYMLLETIHKGCFYNINKNGYCETKMISGMYSNMVTDEEFIKEDYIIEKEV